jgi:phosphoenolpyruvate carboxylase
MVARSLATPVHLMAQIKKIHSSSVSFSRKKNGKLYPPTEFMKKLAKISAYAFEERLKNPYFLHLVASTTLYPFLDSLRIGSRPSKRNKNKDPYQIQLSQLRAIPWVLCWTQARVLVPNWLGFSDTWKQLSSTEKKLYKKEIMHQPLLATQTKLLAFSLAKIDFGPWLSQLVDNNRKELVDEAWLLLKEFYETKKILEELFGKKDLLWFRPWLKESIYLRSSMIHPLSLLQNIALEKNEEALLRVTVTGIASGMLTTG